MKQESETNYLPFAHQPGEVIGTGRESIVKELGPDWVIKEVNPLNARGENRSEGRMAWFRSPERVKGLSKEQEKLEEIFGKDHFPRAYFVYGKDAEGKEGYMMVQKRIEGDTMRDLIGDEYESEKDMIEQNREQYMAIVWGTKKAFVELGVPIDFHDGNMVRETNTGNIVLIDTGFPSEEGSFVFDGEGHRAHHGLTRAYQRVDRIKQYENFLNLSQREIRELNEQYGLDETDFDNQIEKLDEVRDKLGISAEEIETSKRKDTVGGFLDTVFGENEVVTGVEIIAEARERIGNTDIPKRTQTVLDRLEQEAGRSEGREYWKNLIEGNEE